MARLGKRERAAKRELMRLAQLRLDRTGVCVSEGRMRSRWDNMMPVGKPCPRAWEYNGYTAARIKRYQ